MTFKDHFSTAAQLYADARPRYPEALMDFVASSAPSRERVWDVGCGNGQASLALAERFTHVLATDPSAEQIARAPVCENVRFLVERAEESSADDASCDAVTVAQALHWFDRERFFDEVKRVLKPNGVLVVWGYSTFHIAPVVDDLFTDIVLHAIEPDWPKENALLWHGYESIVFPFEKLPVPALDVEVQWTLDALLTYVRTWSGTRRYMERTGDDVVLRAKDAIAAHWDIDEKRVVRMPIHLQARRMVG
jgi:SAM-dependent methyltransferase